MRASVRHVGRGVKNRGDLLRIRRKACLRGRNGTARGLRIGWCGQH
jgi:hypothetical protein